MKTETKPTSYPLRTVLRVQWDSKANEWVVLQAGVVISRSHSTKKALVDSAVYHARSLWDAGRLSQVVIHDKFGRIQSERTFGEDPKRSKG